MNEQVEIEDAKRVTTLQRAPCRQARRRRDAHPVGVLGTGSHVPEARLRNAEFEVATSDEWIVARTGIRERRIAARGEATSDLAIEAGRRALQGAGIAPEELELLLVATATPDHITPPTVCYVQQGIGAERAAGFDINAACSGFVNALMTAHRLISAEAFGNALVIGADTLSSITDYTDRETCILFGDGAGAVVLGPSADGGEILDHIVGLDGSGSDLIIVPAGGSRARTCHESVERREHYLKLQGRRVFRFATAKICELVREMTERNGLTLDEIDLLVPHQANGRILEAATRTLGLDPRRVMTNVERYGNTSNASIPLALDEAVRTGRVRRGDHVILVAFGGGLSWGASLLRW